jgi:hypothetical protein
MEKFGVMGQSSVQRTFALLHRAASKLARELFGKREQNGLRLPQRLAMQRAARFDEEPQRSARGALDPSRVRRQRASGQRFEQDRCARRWRKPKRDRRHPRNQVGRNERNRRRFRCSLLEQVLCRLFASSARERHFFCGAHNGWREDGLGPHPTHGNPRSCQCRRRDRNQKHGNQQRAEP